MKKLFYKAIDFLLFSNIFIALCAVAQAALTYKLLNQASHPYVLGLMFCSTLAMYNYSILSAKPPKPEVSPFRRVRWIFSHYRLMITISLVAGLSLIPLVLFLSVPAQILLFFLGIICLAYNFPVFKAGDKKFGLRNVSGIKLFLIAFTWALSCVLVPVLELESGGVTTVSARETILLIANRFLFVAAITVPFDIRDLFQDRANELRTIPVLIGERKAYAVCMVLLMIYWLLLFLFNPSVDSGFIGLTVTVILTAWIIFKSGWKQNEYYYFFFLDGTLIVQYLVLEASSSI